VLAIHRLLADAAYDAEHNHALCRQELGIRSTAIRLNPRSTGRKWPKSHYRRQMKRRFPKRKYRQRWQVESTFSQHKRRLGSALTARSDAARAGESLLRVLTHNLMILRCSVIGFQQSTPISERVDRATKTTPTTARMAKATRSSHWSRSSFMASAYCPLELWLPASLSAAAGAAAGGPDTSAISATRGQTAASLPEFSSRLNVDSRHTSQLSRGAGPARKLSETRN
jgi:hypothetical protein